MKIELDVKIPEGYEWTGEYRPTRGVDVWTDGDDVFCQFPSFHPVFILRPINRKVIVFTQDPEGGWLRDSFDKFIRYTPEQSINMGSNRYRREDREE